MLNPRIYVYYFKGGECTIFQALSHCVSMVTCQFSVPTARVPADLCASHQQLNSIAILIYIVLMHCDVHMKNVLRVVFWGALGTSG